MFIVFLFLNDEENLKGSALGFRCALNTEKQIINSK